MASILEDFEYDVYISYRQKDNKGDQWVTGFVNALAGELSASFKDDISIYFDQHPQDGLLETYDVGASLATKVKCLILIPIISKTYCDVKSFAWQNEFLVFTRIASLDQFGLKVRLANGNVASRILPVKISEPDAEDRELLQKELGGMLRAVEFIYREPGVGRPLGPTDDENKNLNKTRYRNQINKVANAITEILTALKEPVRERIDETAPTPVLHLPKKTNGKSKLAIASALGLILLTVAAYFFTSYNTPQVTDHVAQKSIAVLPFVNIGNDVNQEYFSDGLTEELINQLVEIPTLKVIARTSSFSFKGKNEDLRLIGEKLGVTHLLEGTIRRSSNTIRITAQLINASDGTHLFSEKYDRQINDNLDDILKIQDEISASVVASLKLSFFPKVKTQTPRQQNLEVYKLYLKGRFYYFQNDPRTVETFLSALAIDSTYARAWSGLALEKISMGSDTKPYAVVLDEAKALAERALAIEPKEPEAIGVIAFTYFVGDHNYRAAAETIRRGLQLDSLNISLLTKQSQLSIILGKSEEAERIALTMVEIDPINPFAYVTLGRSLWAQGRFTEAERQFNHAYDLSPKNAIIPYSLGLISMEQGKVEEAYDRLTNKAELLPECRILSSLPHFAMGRKQEAAEILKWAESNYADSYPAAIAYCYAYQKDWNKAFKWIDRAIDKKDPDLLIVIPTFFSTELRQNPGFEKVRARLNL